MVSEEFLTLMVETHELIFLRIGDIGTFLLYSESRNEACEQNFDKVISILEIC